jgi:hypothetical protein
VAQAQAYADWLTYCTTNPEQRVQSDLYPTNRGPLVVGSNGKAYQLVVDVPAEQWLAVKRIDMAAAKGVIHPNQAARRNSRLMKRINAATAS